MRWTTGWRSLVHHWWRTSHARIRRARPDRAVVRHGIPRLPFARRLESECEFFRETM